MRRTRKRISRKRRRNPIKDSLKGYASGRGHRWSNAAFLLGIGIELIGKRFLPQSIQSKFTPNSEDLLGAVVIGAPLALVPRYGASLSIGAMTAGAVSWLGKQGS